MSEIWSHSPLNGRYRLRRSLGRGGIGEVFLAEDRAREGRVLAVKVLRADAVAAEKDGLRTEFGAMTRLRHPNLVRVHDFGIIAGTDIPFLTMEFVAGGSLRDAPLPLPPDQVLGLLAQICRALDYIHAREIIHHDLKPANLLLTGPLGAPGTLVKLADFGLASPRGRLSGEAGGTPVYMAPERLTGGSVDRRADLYSLGAVLFHLVAGRPPFDAADGRSLLDRVLHGPPPLPHADQAPSALEGLIQKLMEPRPGRRYPTAAAVIEAVNRLGGTRLQLDSGGARARHASIVGREAERRRLRAWIEGLRQAGAGPGPALLALRGETGIGKTRLLEEVRAQAQLAGVEVVAATFSEWAGRTYGPWPEVTRRLLDLLATAPGSGEPGAARRRDLAPLLREGDGPDVAPGGARGRMLAALAGCLRLAAERVPILICLEDLPAAGPADLAILERAVQVARGARVRVLASARDEDLSGTPAAAFLASMTGSGAAEEMHLGPLSPEEVKQMAGSILGIGEPPRPLPDELPRLAGGNPWFVEDRLGIMLDEGILERGPEGWRVDAERLRRLAPPGSASDLLGARLGRLQPRERRALEALAVAGVPVAAADLAEVLHPQPAPADSTLASLRDGGVLRVIAGDGGPRYAFHRELLPRLVYEACPARRRRSLHRRFARALEARGGAPAEDLARHYEGAGEIDRARARRRQAAREAASRHAYEQAIEHYERAIALGPPPPERADLEEALAGAHEALGANRRAIEALRRVLAGAPEPGREARVQKSLGHNASLVLDFEEAERACQRAIDLYRALGDRDGESDVQRIRGIARSRRNDFDGADECFEAALSICAERGNRDGEARVLNNQGLVRSFRGDHDGAVQLLERALRLHEALDNPRERIGPLGNLGYVRIQQGQHAVAAAILEEAIALGVKLGDQQNVGNARILLADSLRALGRLDAALASLEAALRDHQDTGDSSRQLECHDRIGELHRVLGDVATAAEHHQRALDLARAIGDPVQEAFARASLGLDRLGLGEPGAGDDLHAALHAGRSRSPRAEARALRGLALAEAQRGRWADMADRADRLIVVAGTGDLPDDRAWGLRLLGEAQIGRGEVESGRRLLREAAEAARHPPRPEIEREALLLLSESYRQGGRAGEALEMRQRARRVLEEAAMKIEDETTRSRFLSRADRPASATPERTRRLTTPSPDPDPDRTEERSLGLGAIYEISQAINSILEPDRLLETVMDLAIGKLEADRGVIILFDGPGGEMRVRVARADRETIDDALAYSRHVVQEAARGRPVLSFDAGSDERFKDFRSIRLHGIRSLLCVPLSLRGAVVGTVYLDSRRPQVAFDEEDLRFLEVFANMAALALHNAREFDGLRRENLWLRDQVKGRFSYANILGKSPRMQAVFDILARVADSTLPVLICGESGTGKELVARAIHFSGPRRDAPFFSENCASIPEPLLESELFGHVKGAFTGADSTRPGLLELASGGTLFLDEVGDMSLTMQSKLLRAIQEGEVRPVGGKRIVKIDVRILSATNQDLERLMAEGRFRQDLYYRLNVVKVVLPPLRERKEDIPLLVDHFLRRQAEQDGTPEKRLDVDALALILRHDWPGNVRELENEVRKLAVFSAGEVITLDDINRHHDLFQRLTDLERETGVESIVEVERRQILRALQETGGHRGRAARILGISRATIFRKIKQYGISS